MARAQTLGNMRARVRKLADAGPDTTTGRHTIAEINDMLNKSWQAMRELVSDNGHQLYMKPAVATMTAGATSPYSFGTISMPADCVRVMGIDVQIGSPGEGVRTLLAAMFLERNEFAGLYGQSTGKPEAFHVFNIGTELTTTVTPGKIAILPAPDQNYQYTLWYLPAWTDITDDSYVFDGVAGWDDWVAYDVVLKLAMNENDMANTAGIAAQMQAAAKERLLSGANNTQRVGPARRLDVAGMRARNSHNTRFRYP